MAKWDEILSLPVQNPPTIEFSSADITWSRVEGWQDGVDRVALIPFARVNDFVRGESNLKECPTRFHIEARRRRPPEMNKPKVDGILEYILYWCSFGPDDHRKGGLIRPSKSYNAKRKSPAGRPSNKRGCVCHFIVKRLIADPSVALVIYNFEKHVDKQGLPCHGPKDQKAIGTRAMFAPYISEELRLQVMSLLYVGVPVETIMQRHALSVEKQGGPSNRDDLLTHRYVRGLERKIRRSSYDLDPDDMVSISLWVGENSSHVFYHKDFSDSDSFTLGIQTEWQLQQMIRFCNRSIMASDSRFGTNKLKYPVHSLLAFDSKKNAIPVAWIIAPRFSSNDIYQWLRMLYDRVHSKDPTWKLGGFVVDDPSTDINAIRGIFRCPVLLSFWRVRRSWHKNIIQKCPDTHNSVQIFKQLGEIISNICRDSSGVGIFVDFLEDFVDCMHFVEYFKATWFPRLGVWCDALKSLPLASVETCAAIECYHDQLKLRLMNENDIIVYQRADWLVYKLATEVHAYYWLDAYAEKESFARYWKDEWKCCLSLWTEASSIPDSDVGYGEDHAKFASQDNESPVTIVWNPGSPFAICECSWSRRGNLCKHVIKTIQVSCLSGFGSSISLHQYKRVLLNILSCPPSESLIRDHCTALLVSVQNQLKSLLSLDSNHPIPSFLRTSQKNEATVGSFPTLGGTAVGSDLELVDESLDSAVGIKEHKRKRTRSGPDTCFLEEIHTHKSTYLSKRVEGMHNVPTYGPTVNTEEKHMICPLEDETIPSHDALQVVTDRALGILPVTVHKSKLVDVDETLGILSGTSERRALAPESGFTDDHSQENSLHPSPSDHSLAKTNKLVDENGCQVKFITSDSIATEMIVLVDSTKCASVPAIFNNTSIVIGDDVSRLTAGNILDIEHRCQGQPHCGSVSPQEKLGDGSVVSQNKPNMDSDTRCSSFDNSIPFTTVDAAHA